MGRVADETIETRVSQEPGTVKKSELMKYYVGDPKADPKVPAHSPQEVSDHFNVDLDVVMKVLDLNDKRDDDELEDEETDDEQPDSEESR